MILEILKQLGIFVGMFFFFLAIFAPEVFVDLIGMLWTETFCKNGKYFLHQNMTFVKNYFGEVGEEVEVGWIKYRWFRFWGYRYTIKNGYGIVLRTEKGEGPRE